MEHGLPTARPDLKGDRDNLRYGGLEKSSIPRYHPAGRGYIIGLGRSHRIQPGSSGSRVTVAVGVDSSRRDRHDSLLSAVPNPDRTLINKQEISEHLVEEQADYISIRSSTSARKRRRVSGPQHPFSIINATGDEEADCSSATSDDDSDRSNPADAYEAFRTDQTQQRQRELLKRTASDPQDVDSWLALVEHQEGLVRLSSRDSQVLSASQHRTLVDLRIALFEDALSKVTEPTARQRLIRGLIQEGAKIWDHARQTTEWKKLLSTDASFELRMLHLDFITSNASTFSYEGCLNTVSNYFGAQMSEPPSITRDKHLIYLLSRATLLMKQAGYVERAVATWEANLEFNFFGLTDGEPQEHESSFEDFWDSELPRLGEVGARGWNAPPTPVSVPDASTEANVLPLHSQAGQNLPRHRNQPDHVWAAAERNAQGFWPARTLDDVDDPYQIALFTDISPYLFSTSTNETKTNLLDAFLCFSGLPPVIRGYSDIDAFLCQPEAHRPVAGVVDSMSLFAAKSDPSAAFGWLESSDQCLLAREVIRQLALAQPSNEMLAEYAIALELAVKPTEARKLAKRMLKQRPESTRLYNAYALVECRLGKFETAEKVWATTVDQKATQGQPISDCLFLFRAWIWEAMVFNQSNKVNSLLERLIDLKPRLETKGGRPPNTGRDWSPQVSEEFLRAQLFKAYSQSVWDDLVVCVDLLVFLQYNMLDRNLQAALDTYQQMLSMAGLRLDSGDKQAGSKAEAVEKIHSHRARFISLHTNTPGLQYRPKDVASTLRSSRQIFPHNSALRQLTRDLARKHGFFDRLREQDPTTTGGARDTVALSTSNSGIIIEHLASIENELARDAAYGGTEHSIRAAYTKAKDEDSPARSCPAVQLGHLRWELSLLRGMATAATVASEGTTRPKPDQKKAYKQQVQRVRGAFNSAVAACPWVKEIYLTYFDEALEGVADDWQETYGAMLERGLRVYVEVP